MTNSSDRHAFYIITENDNSGESAHGPYTMAEAESLVEEDEKIVTRTHLAKLRETQPITHSIESKSPGYEKMLREIRSWGIMLLILGVIQVVASEFLSNSWGILLVIVGLASFYFRSPAMFVIYGTTLIWAAISNALSGAGGWVAFSLFQVFLAFQTFRQFFQFRSTFVAHQNIEISDTPKPQLNSDKAARPFPWTSIVLGAVSFIGLILIILGTILFIGLTGSQNLPDFISFAEGLIIDLAVLGFSTGLASILSSYQYKWVSIIGMITGGLVLLIEIGLNFL